jgi:hypothetical protein
MLSTTLSILLVAYLPGAVLFRLPVARRELRAGLSAEERVFWSIVLSVATTSIVGISLAAADWYRFDRLLWVNGALTVLLIAASRGQLRLPASAPPSRTAVLPVGLAAVALAVFLYVPPSEYVIGGRDPGSYLIEGVQIAQRGSLTIQDPLVASVPAEFRDLFFAERPNRWASRGRSRFMAFFVVDPDQGTVVGQFPHLYPVWVAVGYGVNGLSGARQITPLLAVLGVMAVYFCGVWLMGRPAAIAGSLLLAINVAQVWYSRYPNSEVLLQFLAFASILAYGRSSVDGDRFFAPTAAVLLALSVLAHFSGVLLVGAIGLALVLGIVDERRPDWRFVVPLAVGGGLVAWYFSTTMREYLERPLSLVVRFWTLEPALVLASGATVVAMLLVVLQTRYRSPLRTWIPRCVVGAVLILATYAYFFRMPVGRLAVHDAEALREFAAVYVTPVGLAAAVAGLTFVAWRSFWPRLTFLAATLVFACFIFFKIRIIPEHFWLARRFLPVILPATCLLIAAALWGPLSVLGQRSASRATRTALAIPGLALFAFLATQFFSASKGVIEHVEYAGVIPQLEAMNAEFADDDLVLIEARAASDMHTLAVPLSYVYARKVLLMTDRNPDPELFARFHAWARQRYNRLLFVGGGGSRVLSPAIDAIAVRGTQFRIPEYERSYPEAPRQVRLKQFDFGIYELVPRSVATEPFDLDIGGTDDLHVVNFHGKERRGDGTTDFRWSRPESLVLVPNLADGVSRLTLWLSAGGRPATLPPPTVRVRLADQQLGTVTVTDDVLPYEFAIPEDQAAAIVSRDELIEVSITTNTWNPSDALGAEDTRELGVMVDRLRIE